MVPASAAARRCRASARLAPLGLAVAMLISASVARAGKWPPFADDLKVTKPQGDPAADAEALVWQVRVLDVWNRPSFHSDVSHYLRIKIFTERGKEIAGSIDIPYDSKTNVVDLEARTIRPDGTTVDVQRNAFYKRWVVRSSGRKVRAVSFAFPSVERGSIVEYRWTERRYEAWAHGLMLDLQWKIPVRTTELWVRPIIEEGLEFGMRWFHIPTPHFEDAPGGFKKAVLPPTEASRVEPCMPPEYLVKPWVVFFYKTRLTPPPERFWSEYSRTAVARASSRMRSDASIEKRAVELAGGAASDDEKLDRIHDFCRSTIRIADEDAVGAEPGNEDAESNGSAGETLKRGTGSEADIDYLFAAMARSLGFETRIARTVDRRTFFFDPNAQLPGLLEELCVAVKSGGLWRYFDPGSRYIPAGMIPWWEEGQQAILLDPKQEAFVTLPVAPPDSNRAVRTGHFQLLADGSLEGTASETFTGHWAADWKEELDGKSPEKRAEDLKGALREAYPGAVVDSVRFEHVSDVEGPLVRTYRIRIPNYAARAGSRLLASPAFFQAGAKPLFDHTERHYPVFFAYPAVRTDEVWIELPDSLQVESTPEARPFTVPGFMRLESSVQVALDGRSIRHTRTARTCDNGEISFPVSEYPSIKAAYDRMHELDRAAISFRKVAAVATK